MKSSGNVGPKRDTSLRWSVCGANANAVYLVLICPTAVYFPTMYFFFPETKGRTLEELGALFGDTNVATRWYGISDAEKELIHQNALRLTETGHIREEGTDQGNARDSNGNSCRLEK